MGNQLKSNTENPMQHTVPQQPTGIPLVHQGPPEQNLKQNMYQKVITYVLKFP